MASFPDSVPSFATKAAGDKVPSADWNSITGEIVAIAGGITQGTAPLSSSNSTHAALSVTGNSTFANRPTMPPPNAARVFRTSTYAAASSVTSTLTWDAQEYATNSSIHSTGTNSERLTPQSTGLYFFTGQVVVNVPSATSQVRVHLVDSSAVNFAAQDVTLSAIGGIVCSGMKRFDVLGGYATLLFTNVAGGSTISLSSGTNNTWFSMVKL